MAMKMYYVLIQKNRSLRFEPPPSPPHFFSSFQAGAVGQVFLRSAVQKNGWFCFSGSCHVFAVTGTFSVFGLVL